MHSTKIRWRDTCSGTVLLLSVGFAVWTGIRFVRVTFEAAALNGGEFSDAFAFPYWWLAITAGLVWLSATLLIQRAPIVSAFISIVVALFAQLVWYTGTM